MDTLLVNFHISLSLYMNIRKINTNLFLQPKFQPVSNWYKNTFCLVGWYIIDIKSTNVRHEHISHTNTDTHNPPTHIHLYHTYTHTYPAHIHTHTCASAHTHTPALHTSEDTLTYTPPYIPLHIHTHTCTNTHTHIPTYGHHAHLYLYARTSHTTPQPKHTYTHNDLTFIHTP